MGGDESREGEGEKWVRTPEERHDADGDHPHVMRHDRKVDQLRRDEHAPANKGPSAEPNPLPKKVRTPITDYCRKIHLLDPPITSETLLPSSNVILSCSS